MPLILFLTDGYDLWLISSDFSSMLINILISFLINDFNLLLMRFLYSVLRVSVSLENLVRRYILKFVKVIVVFSRTVPS